MKAKSKLFSLLLLSAGATAATAIINKTIKMSATAKRLLNTDSQSLCYKWRLGNISYTKSGTGNPLLLIHDLNYSSSSCEWSAIVNKLKEKYTVYTIDLLGCGQSEKPNLTYTNYLFVQLINDFIKSEIGHRTNVIATGESASFITMACSADPELFDKLLFINPIDLYDSSHIPGKYSKIYKLILDLPVFGTLFYNIACSHSIITESFQKYYFYNPFSVKPQYIEKYYESAHLGDCPKSIYSSIRCNYLKCNMMNAIKKIDNSIYILGGGAKDNIKEVINIYKQCNPAIESSIIPKTKHLPQLEDPGKVLETILMFFS